MSDIELNMTRIVRQRLSHLSHEFRIQNLGQRRPGPGRDI